MNEPVVRVVVERAEQMRCPLQPGDSFEVCGSELRTPGGKPFCLHAMAAALPVVGLRQSDRPVDDWLERKPFVCCPDAAETMVMRLDRDADGGWTDPAVVGDQPNDFRLRCTVESMQYSACGLAVGDWFEVSEAGVSVPDGKGFCWFAIAGVLPALHAALNGNDAGRLAEHPLLACPDPPEALFMRVERIDAHETDSRETDAHETGSHEPGAR